MTAVKTAPAIYVSGHCAVGRHDACRGLYAGVACGCDCRHQPAEPEPEPEPVNLDVERVETVTGQVPLPGMPEVEQPVLFPVAAVDPGHAEPPAKLSADRRRTLRQREQIALGIHPLTRGPARYDLGTCGLCAHRVRSVAGFPKCELGPNTRSANTDVRRWWPACERFEPRL